jgi:hypothetical protein
MQHQQPSLFTREDGHALASSMMQEIQSFGEADMDIFSMEAQYRDGRPQNNILFEYLKTVTTHGSDAAMAGFAAVLTDALAFPGTSANLYQAIAQEAQLVTA